MYKILLTFSLLFFIQVQNNPVISWSDNYRITWNNFKAKPPSNVSAVATTASGITFGFSIKQSDARVVSFTTEVYAHFYPEESWYKPERADSHVLGHERLHFDITELFARKFRQRISVLKTTNDIAKRLKVIHKNINKELEVYQNQYDAETDYSRNVEGQRQWEARVKRELKVLELYKSTK